jgi:hypothetical protein
MVFPVTLLTFYKQFWRFTWWWHTSSPQSLWTLFWILKQNEILSCINNIFNHKNCSHAWDMKNSSHAKQICNFHHETESSHSDGYEYFFGNSRIQFVFQFHALQMWYVVYGLHTNILWETSFRNFQIHQVHIRAKWHNKHILSECTDRTNDVMFRHNNK